MPITDNSPWWQEQQNSNRPLNWNVYSNPNSNSKAAQVERRRRHRGAGSRIDRPSEPRHSRRRVPNGKLQQEGSSN